MTRKRNYNIPFHLYVSQNDKVEIYFDHSDTLVIAKQEAEEEMMKYVPF